MGLAGVIFDLDGTLADTLPVCFAAFRQTLRRFTGATYTNREIRNLFGPSEEGVFQRLAPDRAGECMEAYIAAYEEEHRRCTRPFPGIPEALEALRERQVRMAVVTGKGPRSAAISLRVLGLERYFDSVEAGSPNGGVKAACMRRVLDAWGIDPAAVAGLGDSPSDVRAAREAGMTPLAAAWAPQAETGALHSQQPAALFRAAAEFGVWLERALSGGADTGAARAG